MHLTPFALHLMLCLKARRLGNSLVPERQLTILLLDLQVLPLQFLAAFQLL
jgi:hypothetical protein